MNSLYEEIKAIDADEEDDKAMGDVEPEKVAKNEEVRLRPVLWIMTHKLTLQRRTCITWRALRQRTQTDNRSCAALRDKRDLHLLFRKSVPKPKEAGGAGGETTVGAVQEVQKPEGEVKEDEEDVAAEDNVEVKPEEGETHAGGGTKETVTTSTDIEVDAVAPTNVATDELEPTTGTGTVDRVDAEGWPVTETEEAGSAKEVVLKAESGSSGMDVDRPPTPEALPASDADTTEVK